MILNKKSIANQESQLFKAELEKFRAHQNRLLQANHKQASVLKELTKSYSDLLQDKRVRSEQSKYEAFSRQRVQVMTKYKKIFQAFNDLVAGLAKAREFYSEMKETVESLSQNVETFVNNRRSEGGQLLSQIEAAKDNDGGQHAERERERLKELMERMSMGPSNSSASPPMHKQSPRPSQIQQQSPFSIPQHSTVSPSIASQYSTIPAHQLHQPPQRQQQQQQYHHQITNGFHHGQALNQPQSYNQYASAPEPYNPINYPPVSPPPTQQHFSSQPATQTTTSYGTNQYQQAAQQAQSQYMPLGYVPPPPPPGPPPQQYQDFSHITGSHPSGPGGYAQNTLRGQTQQGSQDPRQELNAWR